MRDRYVLVCPLGEKGVKSIIRFQEGGPVTASEVVEQWQRDWDNAPCKWKVAEGSGWVGAMIESASFCKKGQVQG